MYPTMERPSNDGLLTFCLNQNVACTPLAHLSQPTHPFISSTSLNTFAEAGGLGIIPPPPLFELLTFTTSDLLPLAPTEFRAFTITLWLPALIAIGCVIFATEVLCLNTIFESTSISQVAMEEADVAEPVMLIGDVEPLACALTDIGNGVLDLAVGIAVPAPPPQ